MSLAKALPILSFQRTSSRVPLILFGSHCAGFEISVPLWGLELRSQVMAVKVPDPNPETTREPPHRSSLSCFSFLFHLFLLRSLLFLFSYSLNGFVGRSTFRADGQHGRSSVCPGRCPDSSVYALCSGRGVWMTWALCVVCRAHASEKMAGRGSWGWGCWDRRLPGLSERLSGPGDAVCTWSTRWAVHFALPVQHGVSGF